MKYELFLHERDEASGEVKVSLVLSTPSKQAIDAALAALRRELHRQAGNEMVSEQIASAVRRPGPKGRRVHVWAVEEGSGTSLQPGDTFETAAELSRILGAKYNVVSMELAKVAGKEFPSATVQGVEFIYEDSIPASV